MRYIALPMHMPNLPFNEMNPEPSARRRLRDSRNNSFSFAFNNLTYESGLNTLIDSPILLSSPNNGTTKPSILKKRKASNGNTQSRETVANCTITLDSSSEVIDKSTRSSSIVNELDWIKTPRSARNKLNVKNNSDSRSSTNPKQRKSLIGNDEKKTSIREVKSKQANAKTPTFNLLSGSKRQNVDNWLKAAVHQPPSTPPMSLSPIRKPYLDQSEIDPEVKKVLMLVYGDDWNAKPLKKSQTDVKRSKRKSPQRVLTDARPLCKPNNIQQSIEKTNRKNVRRKVFDDHSIKKQAPDVNVATSLQFNDSKNLTTKLKGVKRKRSPGRGDNIDLIRTPVAPSKAPSKCPSGLKTPRRTFLASLSVSTPTTASHPAAQSYKLHFAKKKEELCAKLFKLYNTEVFSSQLPSDMLIEWNGKMRGTAGFCYSKRRKTRNGIVRSARLELSPRVIDRADRLRDTLIHEMCHAAAWIINGVQDGHGTVWLSWAQKVAIRFPELPPIKRCHNYQIITKFTYKCTVCSYSIYRQSRSIDIQRKRCGRCYGVLELLFNKKKRGIREVPEFETTRTIRAPNRFALYVKENYKTVKVTMPSGKKHADVMKLLAEQYAHFKSNLV